jgi:tRNA (mo5U34)-methyltransferase
MSMALASRHYVLGVHDEHAFHWPEHQIRSFRRGAVEFSATIHACVVPRSDRVLQGDVDTDVCMHHLSYVDVAQWIEKTNRYTSCNDRARVAHAGTDLISFAHARIDYWMDRTRDATPGGYPATVALLRATYDLVDRLKIWEEERGLDGATLFRQVCAELDAAHGGTPSARAGEHTAAMPPVEAALRARMAQEAKEAPRTKSLAGVERSGPCQNAGSGKTGRERRMNLNQGDYSNPASQLAHLASVGEWDAAVEVGLHHLGEGQEDGQLFSRIASLLLDAQMIDAAEAYIQQGYIRWPDYVWLPWQYAKLATMHRDFEVAASRWQDLMARHPESPLGLCGLGELYRLAGREDDAARLFAEAVTRYPDFVWAAHHHAATSTRCLDWTTATRRWAAVRDRFPDHIPAHEQLAHALMEDGRLPEAEAAARRGLAAFPQDQSLAAIAARVAERMRERTLKDPAVAAPARTTAPAATRPHFDALRSGAPAFVAYLANLKRGETVPFDWYPYGTMANLEHIAQLVTDELDTLFASGTRIADIGAADGDLAFYLESCGHRCDIFDNGPTNFNGLAGARHMKRVLGSAVNIIEQDLDSQFRIEGNYDLVLLLGILYHLKNPFYVLERLSEVSRYLLLSTRVARHFRTGHADVSEVPAAYLLAPDEANNDATNFWIFTAGGVRRLANRAGWEVVGFRTVGDTAHSNPQDNDRDERAFALLRSRKV